jgi:hypothetical protein
VNQENQELFALGLAPEQNIIKTINDLRAEAFGLSGTPEALSLPAAIFLGFFKRSETAPLIPKKNAFVSECASLFETLPERLSFSRFETDERHAFLVAEPQIPGQSFQTAKMLAESWGLCRTTDIDYPKQCPSGFFIGETVTPQSFNAFSFCHFSIVLYRIESCTDVGCSGLYWTELAKAPRKRKQENKQRVSSEHRR